MPKLSARQTLFLALIAAALAVLAVLRFSPEDEDPAAPIIVGVLAPFGSTPGEGIRNGVAMAADEINQAGGVGGRPFKAIEIDTGFTVEKAVAGYQQLAGADGAVAIIGLAGDGVFAVMEQLSNFKVPVLATGTAADRLTEMVGENPDRFKYFFRVMHRSGELADATAGFARDFLHAKLGMERFAILVENAVWTGAIRAEWERTIEETDGMELVFSDSFSSETKDFFPVFSRIRESGAEYVLDAGSKVEATHYLKQWAVVEGPPIGAIATGVGTQKYYEEIGDQGISVCSVSTIPDFANRATERSETWWQHYFERYGSPEYTSGYSYDAVYILKRAIEHAESTDGDSLIPALEKTDYVGVAARWQFDGRHHPRFGEGYRTIPIIQYFEPGAQGYRVIWPEERAQGEFVYPAWTAADGA